jgi:hypothetical protein
MVRGARAGGIGAEWLAQAPAEESTMPSTETRTIELKILLPSARLGSTAPCAVACDPD